MGAENLTITCPCCEAKITLDRITGAVLAHEKPSGPSTTFEEAVSDEKKRRQDAEDRFSQAVREQENREEIWDKKFKEALQRAEKDDKPPPRPFEFD